MKLYPLLIIIALTSNIVWAQKGSSARLLPPPDASKSISIRFDSTARAPLIKDASYFDKLDGMVRSAIAQKAMPGCQVLALKNGVVVYEKNYGTFNYNAQNPVTSQSLYDIASVTKIAATTLAIMKLYEEGKISLQGNLMAYLPMVKGTNKANLRLSDLLTHQAGLKSWIPFYRYTLDENTKQPAKHFYSNDSSSKYSIPVAKNLYAAPLVLDTIWTRILTSPLDRKGRYVYSDLDLLFLEKVVEYTTGMTLDLYVEHHFYKPMGLKNITYNPWAKGLSARCVPTENDGYFRMQLVRGYVHDQGAAMLGGVAGHAGLFSNARDVAAIMQMLLDGGVYNGKQYFKPETVKLFTGYRSSISRRGYGFDKPEKQAGKGGPAADICSKSTFGHQGFTGTCAWADPEHGIVFVLLANRVFPSAENNLFARLDVRTNAQHYIYKALGY